MKSIFKKVAGIALVATLVLGMFSCSNGSSDTSDDVLETVATPTFSVASGEVENGTSVTITCATEGAKIYYTTDGSAPTVASTEYTAAISITEEVTIKAIAVKAEMNDSAVASVSYTIKTPAVPAGFVLIPAGEFQMGSNAGYDEDKPVHTVTISNDFYMCDHEVTQAEYEAVMETNPSYFVGEGPYKEVAAGEVQENRPVDMVNWYMTLVYCNKLSMKEDLTPCYTIGGETDPTKWGTIPTDSADENWDKVTCNWAADGYRLPTEAEWEYAARAGDNTVDALIWGRTNAEDSLDEYAWFISNADWITHEVKIKKPNANGLYDMAGNVSEWCWDCYAEYTSEAVTDPRGGDSSENGRVYRGGAYGYDAEDCVVSYRDYDFMPHAQKDNVGFRVVRNAN